MTAPKTANEIGRMGGKARALRMSPAERSESARRAAQARWAAWREKRWRDDLEAINTELG